jgi:hypothetical protein
MDNNRVNLCCDYCPLTDQNCPRFASNHTRFCQWVDPSSPAYRPDGAQAIVRVAQRSSGRALAAPPRGPERKPDPKPILSPEEPRKRMPGINVIADEETHQRIYEAARDCTHKKESKSCCTPDRCKDSGLHPGAAVNIGMCYECTAKTLGIGTRVPT